MTRRIMTSKRLAKELDISRATLTRWVKAGCPHALAPGCKNKKIFDYDIVMEWLYCQGEKRGTAEPETVQFQSTKPTKITDNKFKVYDHIGRYVKTVKNVKKELLPALVALRSEHGRPYSIDKGDVFRVEERSKVVFYDPGKHGKLADPQK